MFPLEGNLSVKETDHGVTVLANTVELNFFDFDERLNPRHHDNGNIKPSSTPDAYRIIIPPIGEEEAGLDQFVLLRMDCSNIVKPLIKNEQMWEKTYTIGGDAGNDPVKLNQEQWNKEVKEAFENPQMYIWLAADYSTPHVLPYYIQPHLVQRKDR